MINILSQLLLSFLLSCIGAFTKRILSAVPAKKYIKNCYNQILLILPFSAPKNTVSTVVHLSNQISKSLPNGTSIATFALQKILLLFMKLTKYTCFLFLRHVCVKCHPLVLFTNITCLECRYTFRCCQNVSSILQPVLIQHFIPGFHGFRFR